MAVSTPVTTWWARACSCVQHQLLPVKPHLSRFRGSRWSLYTRSGVALVTTAADASAGDVKRNDDYSFFAIRRNHLIDCRTRIATRERLSGWPSRSPNAEFCQPRRSTPGYHCPDRSDARSPLTSIEGTASGAPIGRSYSRAADFGAPFGAATCRYPGRGAVLARPAFLCLS
jgi:hypothetical protein